MVRIQATTSPATSSILDLTDTSGRIKDEHLGYFAGRAQNEAHEIVLALFTEYASRGGSRAEIGRALGKQPAQITRWLGSPGNWTLETFAHLLLAMGYVSQIGAHAVAETGPITVPTFVRANESQIVIEDSYARSALDYTATVHA